jgi:hypothetical protein
MNAYTAIAAENEILIFQSSPRATPEFTGKDQL